MELFRITDELVEGLGRLKFSSPVTHVYNPLEYARKPYDGYLRKYGRKPNEVVLVGMNPGPWGMAQTGVPFGEIAMVRDWMGIEAPVGQPASLHPKRPVDGFKCKRSEVSGKRLWGWARKTFVTPQVFFSRFFVANYCPLMFLDSDGRNRTPNNLKAPDKKPLFAVCDQALRETVHILKSRHVVGIGAFAAGRAEIALADMDVNVGRITHPSPANPKANKGWGKIIKKELQELGIVV
ncbi:uracil-DNA glycosylase family protein [Thermodesulfobacteriota bacterium]